jgi:hypothetical protein
MKTLLIAKSATPTLLTELAPATSNLFGQLASALHTLHRTNAPLAWAGWASAGLALVALGLLPLDHRHVTGALVWIKPLKFSLSILLYAWTLAWLLASLPAAAQGAVRTIGWGVALSMMVELAVIFTQAARGTSSHYNATSAFDSTLFGLMGVFIMLNTVLTGWALYLVWHHQPQGSAGYVWGVRLGMLVFLVGSILGGIMIRHMQHTIGAPDGGPGLPGLGWSTRAGDVRVAHFLGLHAMQALPLLGWALGRWVPQQAVAFTWLGAALYAAAVAGLLAQALAGQPLWAAR